MSIKRIIFAEWALSINPFIKKIPKRRIDLYREDYLNEGKNHKLLKIGDNSETIFGLYTILVGCALKPNNKIE